MNTSGKGHSQLFDQKVDHEFEKMRDFNPSSFFIPGWKGDGLITANGLHVKSMLNNLTIDAIATFKKINSTSALIKKQTFNEFISYCEWAKLDKELFKQTSDFWFHYQDVTSPYHEKIQEFIQIYCYRAVAIYLFRIKFIFEIAAELHIEVSEDILLNPLSFVNRIFKKNSSSELNCESLQTNQYSWYRPTLEYKESLLKSKEAFSNVTITELLKLLSTSKNNKFYSLKNYSHSLSHVSFGSFINQLLIKFPNWISGALHENAALKDSFLPVITNQLPKVVTTQFEGQHTSSMALSHWLAQQCNIKKSQWDHLICPDFLGLDFIDGHFLKLCQELQFLSFLTRYAFEHKFEVVPFICKIMKEKARPSIDGINDQISFFNLGIESHDIIYDRLVLNLCEAPKTNPHHHLCQQIAQRKKAIKNDGVLFVLTNQKLFVPSYSDRVEQLLKDFKVQGTISLDELKGKGEIPQYIYILTKRPEIVESKFKGQLYQVKRLEKESCSSFVLKGNLTHFNKFQKVVDEFDAFIKAKKASHVSIHSKDLDEHLSFDYHTDAIIEGKLVSATSNKEQGHLPHPSFFKNLTKSSVSLDTYFHIENLDPFYDQNTDVSPTELLGIKVQYRKNYSLLLIVNQSNPLNIEIDLAPFESFKAKIEECGTAYHTYFGLTPKLSAINLNVFREYFASNIGFQIIQMQLSDDGPTKLKSKLKSLLVPAFFARTNFMPNENQFYFKILEENARDLIKLHPDELKRQFQFMEDKFNLLKSQYPWHLLGLLANFKLNLKTSISDIDSNNLNDCQFSNPLVASELMTLKTFKIYPTNEEIYVDIVTKTPSDLHLPLSSFQVKFDSANDSYSLFLSSKEKRIVAIYSTQVVIQFIKFILQKGIGVKISDILVGLRSPTSTDLELVLKKFGAIKENKSELLTLTNELINRILSEQIH